MPRVDTAIGAIGAVEMADQIMRGIRDDREHQQHDAQNHYVKAAIAGAIAIGAYEMLRRDESHATAKDNHLSHHDGAGADGAASVHGSDGHHKGNDHKKHHHKGGYTDFVAEALGAYSVGRQAMGHSDHNILKLVAEGLGAIALSKEAKKELAE